MNMFKHRLRIIALSAFMSSLLHLSVYSQSKTPKVTFAYSTGAVTKTLYVRSNPAPPACSGGPVVGLRKASVVARLNWKADYLSAVTNQYTVNLLVSPFTSFSGTGGALPTYSKSLVVKYDQPQSYVSIDITDIYPTANRLDVRVTYVNSGGTQTAVESVIQTDVFYTEEFSYNVTGATVTASSATASGSEYLFKWTTNTNCTPAPNYQFQIMRLFNRDTLATSEASIRADIDWERALSIETGNSLQELALTLAEGTGYYIWRVRAIGNAFPGGIANDQNWGPWSATGTMSGLNKQITGNESPHLFFYTQFDAEKNWIFSRSFVEGDVIEKGQVTVGEGIQYANGLEMGQQQQTRMRSNGKKLVGQTIADFSGRPALTVLPAPVAGSTLGYINSYIKNNSSNTFSGTVYSAYNFDSDSTIAPTHIYLKPDPIDSTAQGPGSYYSNKNNLESDVPTAGGHPYSRTLFMNDGTSRPKEQSSPGIHHKLGNTGNNRHTTRNYISSTTDGELITILGDEAPDAKSVSKSVTIDANGKSSISYISKEGKTLATCFSSPAASSLELLPTAATGGQTINCNLNAVNVAYGNSGVRSFKNIVLAESATLNFTYNITPKIYQDACANFCASCDYKITIRIINNDNPSLPVKINSKDAFVDSIAPVTGTSSCTAALKTLSIPAVTLGAGSYTIERIIEAREINRAPSPPAPATAKTPFIEQYLKQQEAALLSRFKNATTVTAYIIDGFGNTATYKYNISMPVVNSYLYAPPSGDITVPLFQPNLNGLYTYLGVPANLLLPQDGLQATQNVKVKLQFDNCNSIIIPVVACAATTCPPPVSGIYDFEKAFIDWYLTKNPGTPGVTINTLFNGVPFTFNPGDFNTIVTNMLDPARIATGCRIYDKDAAFRAWQAIYMSSGSPLVNDCLTGTTVNNQSAGGVNSTNLSYTNNYLDMFISNARYGNRHGYQIQGINNALGGLGASNPGYKFHPYAYMKNPPSCDVCERAYFSTLGCTPSGPVSSCYSPQPNFIAFFNADTTRTKIINSGKDTLFPKNSFYNCIKSVVSCTPPNPVTPANFALYTTDSCKKTCDARYQLFVSDIKNLYNKSGKYVEGDIYGLAVSTVNPSIYVFNNSSHTYVPGTDIAKSTIYCQAQNMVDACKSMCTITVDGTTGGVGTAAQQAIVRNVIGGNFDLKLTSGGTCTGGYTATPNAAQTITIASTIANLNRQLEIERANAPVNGLYWNFVNFLKGINNAAVVNSCTGQLGYVLIHPAIPSYFEYDAAASKIVYYFNKGGNATFQPKRLFSYTPPLVNPGFFYSNSISLTAEQATFTECYENPLYGGYLFGNGFSPFTQGSAPAKINILEIRKAISMGAINGMRVPADTTIIRYNTADACVSTAYWKQTLCATVNSSSLTCPSICYKLIPPVKLKTDSILFKNEGVVFTTVSCEQAGAQQVLNSIGQQVAALVSDQNVRLRKQYQLNCIDLISDVFSATYAVNYYHYTLYYYDRAGNLIKTVPPEGVVKGAANRMTHPAHKLVTSYTYNSLSQLTRQKSPDGGETFFWYDDLARLRFSQNKKQLMAGKMSYTKYDALGRIVETGEAAQASAPTQSQLNDINYPAPGVGKDITVTEYSQPDYSVCYLDQNQQRFVQNRVSNSCTDRDGNLSTTTDQVKTWYSYDPHGNVEWIIQSIPDLGLNYIGYEYDLLSGSVVRVNYNSSFEDRFFHRYAYDSDKRIKTVETSKDSVEWEKDASYAYYAHGPLKRTQLGHDKLQGLDYTYTIQGWLKGINHIESPYDPGKDGTLNAYYAKDAYSLHLGYYDGDYLSKSSAFNAVSSNPNYLTTISGQNLYNGNIKSWIQNYDYASLPDSLNDYGNATGRTFRYDELNRIRQSQYASQAAATRTWTKYLSSTQKYYETFTYDGNGNIKTARRNTSTGSTLDSLAYNYNINLNNRLLWVDERAAVTSDLTDIEDQSSGNYAYDSIGNLTKDIKENISLIEWNIYGKIARIVKTDATELLFLYDAGGNRVYKKVYKPADAVNAVTTFYVRDANGNVMATYKRTFDNSTTERVSLVEQPIYGSSRIGQRMPSLFRTRTVTNPTVPGTAVNFPYSIAGSVYNRLLKTKNYELTDHLGNVHAVIADYKTPSAADPNTMWDKRFDNGTTEGFAVNTTPAPPAGTTVTNIENQLRIFGTSGSTAKVSLNTTTLPAGRYALSFDYIAGNTSLASYTIAANPANNALNIIGYLSSSGRQNIVFDVPASGVTSTDVLFKCETAIASREFFIDNILIKKVSSTLSDASVILTDNFNSQPAGYSAWTVAGANLSYTLVTTGNYKLTAVNSGSVSSASISKRVSLIPGLTYKVNFLLDATTIGTGSPKILFEYYDNDNSNSDYRAFVRSTNGASPASPGYTFYITPLTADGTFTIKWENTATSTFNFAVDDFIITQYENKSIPLYSSVINSMTDYTAFGAPLGGRNFSSLNYRYGFNGKENDNEVKGVAGSQQDYGFRIYDPRLGRFLSVDPISRKYAMLTPYQFASNTPIQAIDIDGLEAGYLWASTGYSPQTSPEKAKDDLKKIGKRVAIEIGKFSLQLIFILATDGAGASEILGEEAVAAGAEAAVVEEEIITLEAREIISSNPGESKITIEKSKDVITKAESNAASISPKPQQQPTNVVNNSKNPYFSQTKKELISSKRTYEKLIAEHEQKLKDYVNNPLKHDNKDILKNAPTKEIRDKIIAGRVKELISQITKQKEELVKVNEALKKVN